MSVYNITHSGLFKNGTKIGLWFSTSQQCTKSKKVVSKTIWWEKGIIMAVIGPFARNRTTGYKRVKKTFFRFQEKIKEFSEVTFYGH